MASVYILYFADGVCADTIACFENEQLAKKVIQDLNLYIEELKTEEKMISYLMSLWDEDNPIPKENNLELLWYELRKEKNEKVLNIIKEHTNNYIDIKLRKYLTSNFTDSLAYSSKIYFGIEKVLFFTKSEKY